MMKIHVPVVSILGCGWLGMPLAQHLISRGFTVKGSTTHPEKLSLLKKNKIQPYLIQLNPQINPDYQAAFFESEILIINIPPGRSPEAAALYPQKMKALISVIRDSAVKKILFISSTSVYPDINRKVTEENAIIPEKPGGIALVQAEEVFMHNPYLQASILRFCGLYGPGRNPGRFLAGKIMNTAGRAGVNLIHLEDCIRIITCIIERDIWGEVFNACADEHPARKDFYPLAARACGLVAPRFEGREEESFKIISSRKLKSMLGYQFLHPDPLKFIFQE